MINFSVIVLSCVLCTSIFNGCVGTDYEEKYKNLNADYEALKGDYVNLKEEKADKNRDAENNSDFSYADVTDHEFIFTSGAGGWATELEINRDGSFQGEYHDYEMGETGDGYEDGSCYYCKFTGKFGDLEKIDALTYRTTIKELHYDKKENTSEIIDHTKYEYTYAYGLDQAQDMYFYLPGSKTADLPKDFVHWVNMANGVMNDSQAEDTFTFYGLYNENGGYGFFSDEHQASDHDTASNTSDIPDISFEYKYSGNTESAVVTATDAAGTVVWTYTSDDYSRTELHRIVELGVENDDYYLMEDGTILCLDTHDGTLLWKNPDFGGSPSTEAFVFDSKHTLYISGYYGPDLFVVDKNGNTLKKVDTFDSDYYWPYKLSLNGDKLTIYYEGVPKGSSGTGVVDLNNYRINFQ